MSEAQKITPEHIASIIVGEYYFTAKEGVIGHACAHLVSEDVNLREVFEEMPVPHESLPLLTFCVLVLKNGFTVTGESACADPKIFNAVTGRNVARQNAVAKIWQLEGYLLKERLSELE